MKTQTITLYLYPLYQASGYGAEGHYRGKDKFSITNADRQTCKDKALELARALGYTHRKFF